MSRYPFLLLCVAVFGCTKEKTTRYTAVMKNATSHPIQIRPFRDGAVVTSKIIDLSANSSLQIADGMDRGLVINGGFFSDYLAYKDSVQVVYDNQYIISHYIENPVTQSSKFYAYSSLRNIGNYKSYTLETTDRSAYKRENDYTYTFTEWDYRDAQ